MRQKILAVGVIRVQAVNLAEGVVQRGVERAGDHERTQHRDRLGQRQLPCHLRGGLEVFRFQRVRQVDRVADLGAAAGDSGDSFRPDSSSST